MKLVIVLVLSLTAVYNQGLQSGFPAGNLEIQQAPPNVQNPRIRRSPNPYYGLFNYLYSSPFINRPAAMTRRIGAARRVLSNPQQPVRSMPSRAQATAPAPQRAQAVQTTGDQIVPRNRAQAIPRHRAQTLPRNKAQTLPRTRAQTLPRNRAQTMPRNRAQTLSGNRAQTNAQTLPRNRAPTMQNNVSPFGFGRGMGMFGAIHGLRDRSRLGGVGGAHGFNGLVGRNRDRSHGLDGIRGVGLGAGLYRARSGNRWRSYGGSSGGEGSYYYRKTGPSGKRHGSSRKGSYYYRGGHGHGGGYGGASGRRHGGSHRGSYYYRGGSGSGHGSVYGHGHGKSYWSRS